MPLMINDNWEYLYKLLQAQLYTWNNEKLTIVISKSLWNYHLLKGY